MVIMVLCPAPEGSPAMILVLKRLRRWGHKVSSDGLREAGNGTCDHCFTRHRFIPYTTAASKFYADFVLF